MKNSSFNSVLILDVGWVPTLV